MYDDQKANIIATLSRHIALSDAENMGKLIIIKSLTEQSTLQFAYLHTMLSARIITNAMKLYPNVLKMNEKMCNDALDTIMILNEMYIGVFLTEKEKKITDEEVRMGVIDFLNRSNT